MQDGVFVGMKNGVRKVHLSYPATKEGAKDFSTFMVKFGANAGYPFPFDMVLYPYHYLLTAIAFAAQHFGYLPMPWWVSFAPSLFAWVVQFFVVLSMYIAFSKLAQIAAAEDLHVDKSSPVA